ncbi:trypsin-7-like [Battus philenor]|uniref:trypsin-7-like n=1 Tax=Battus philenor TaxID=42288 RepID=UPI0035D12DB1
MTAAGAFSFWIGGNEAANAELHIHVHGGRMFLSSYELFFERARVTRRVSRDSDRRRSDATSLLLRDVSVSMCALAVLTLCALAAAAAAANATTYCFVREGGGGGAGAAGARRVFGGAAAALRDFPAACALLDRYLAARCSGAVLAPHWALTAAHCIAPLLAYVKYNTRRPASDRGDVAAVHYLYRHPEYRVLQEDEGHGMDVTLLHHDVGLVRTRDRMALAGAALPRDPLVAMRRYDPMNLIDQEVQVLGFGRTEARMQGEELCGARLRLVRCARAAWYHVVCGAAGAAGGAGGEGRAGGPADGGVCAGDSGGPLVFAGVQLAVTSMGPRRCARGAAAEAGAVSVFTALRPYVDVLNATMADTDAALRMRIISAAARSGPLVAVAASAHTLLNPRGAAALPTTRFVSRDETIRGPQRTAARDPGAGLPVAPRFHKH